MKRGEIWVANLNPNKGSEPGKTRPVIVYQSDVLNEVNHPSTIIIPLTSQIDDNPRTTSRLRVTKRDLLENDSDALIDQIGAISTSRFKEGPIGSLTGEELTAIRQILDPILGYFDEWT